MRILHIAAHMGGGIGAAYAGLGSCGQEQSILLLEEPIDRRSLAKVETAGFHILKDTSSAVVAEELRRTDVVVFSWYHHPAMTRFMRELPDIPIRSVLWSHVFGGYYPHIPSDFLTLFEQAAFTTPLSLELPAVKALGENYIANHCNVVCGLNDLTPFTNVAPVKHIGFVIGYVGTLNFFKLHPDFVSFCAAADIPDVKFVIAGDPTTKEEILRKAAQRNIADRFHFCGHISNVPQLLSQIDVFGYPLNPEHSGTTENALLEAMAAGLPAVALDQCVERHIIKDGVTGFLVHSPAEYGQAMKFLYEHPKERSIMGAWARADMLERYAVQDNRKRFLQTCEKAMRAGKTIPRFKDFFRGEPADWFLSCVEEDRTCFEENRAGDSGWFFHERTKSSPIHYHTYFPEDSRLALWAKQLMRC